MRGSEGFADQGCDLAPELVMMRRDKAAPLAVKGVENGKFLVAVVTVFGEVWGV